MPRRERPLDSTEDDLGRFAAELRQVRTRAGSPTYRELSATAHYSATVLSQAAGGRQLPTLPVTLAYVLACGGDAEVWRARWHEVAARMAADVDRDGGRAGDTASAPYVGLAAFEPDDADRFFGRDELVADLVERVRRQRFVGVFGASGSGKSSVLRAGVVAGVRKEGLADTGPQPTILFTPGPNPIEEMAVRLAEFAGRSAALLITELAENPNNLHLRVRETLAAEPTEVDLLVVVDQFEEVFTLCRDPRERSAFIGALVTAATAATSRTRVVLGVRADFYGHCGQHPELVKALRDAQVLVGPMDADQLRQAVTQPAARAGLTVETALVSRVVADATGQPAVLPLLSHALLETWRRRRGTRLTLVGYQETGGMPQAIARTAERIYTTLDPAQQAVARTLFLRLTALGEGTEDTKRRISRQELDATSDTATVLETLTRARLLTADHDSLHIAHEALIRSWPRLQAWLAEDRDGLRVHRQLTAATDDWEAVRRDSGALYRGARLAMARDWAVSNDAALTVRERQFLTDSLAAAAAEQTRGRRRTRRLREITAMLAALLLVATTSTVLAVRAQNTAAEQRDAALGRKAASDAAALRAANPALSLQVSLAAYRLAPVEQTRDNLLSAFATPYARRLSGHTGDIFSLAVSADGRTLVTASADRTARLWDITDRIQPRQVAVLENDTAVRAVAFGLGGHLLASVSGDTARLWEVTDPARPREVGRVTSDVDGGIKTVALSPDGRTMVTGDGDANGRVWDIADLSHPHLLATLTGHTAELSHVAFSPDGHRIATSGDNTARVWDVTDPRQPRLVGVLSGHTDSVLSVAFSPDGRTAATASWDHTVRLWDVTASDGPRGLAVLTGDSGLVYGVAFSPDGHTLATTGQGTRLWEIADPAHPVDLIALAGGTYAAAFSPDGATLATDDTDNTVRLQDLRDLPLVGHTDKVAMVAFSPDGHTLATADWDHTVRLWDVTDDRHRRPLATLTGHTEFVRAVDFSPDGRTLATAGDDGTVRLWNITDLRQPRPMSVLAPETGEILSVQFSPDGRLLATSGFQTARLWELTDHGNASEIARLDGYPGMVGSVVFSPDGRLLATGSRDSESGSRLWDITDARHPRALAFPFAHNDFVPVGGFSPDGRTLVVVGNGTAVRLVDVADLGHPRQLSVLTSSHVTGHSGTVYSVAFSPDGRTLATARADTTAQLWDVADPSQPRPTATLTGHTADVTTVAFSPDGRVLATGGDQTARLWETDIDKIGGRVCEVSYPRITPAEWEQYFPGLAYQPPCPA